MTRGNSTSVEAISRGVGRVVQSKEQIALMVSELAGRISQCYRQRELTILAVLTGSLIFVADLIRELPLIMRLDLTSVSSYPDDAISSQGAKFRLPPPRDLAGRDVLVVDDILDSGRTLELLLKTLTQMEPLSLRSCVLLRKVRYDLTDRIEPDFVGFDIEDKFVVGYGLDHNHLYRNLPDIRVFDDARPHDEQG